MKQPDFENLVRRICALPNETEWVEFKHNKAEPDDMGEYISALANGAALRGEQYGYVIWGVEDETRKIVGTRFKPSQKKIGNEQLEGWLNRLLTPAVNFEFHTSEVDQQPVVMLRFPRAIAQPVQFRGEEFIRVGSYKKKLKDQPEKARALWKVFDQTPFEKHLAVEETTEEGLLKLLDHSAYFELMNLPLPKGRAGILDALARERLIASTTGGQWNISNLGAVLLARRLSEFPALARKAMRVVQYAGNDRTKTLKEQVGQKGYANGFEGLIGYINALLPANEVIGDALRKSVPVYPELAVREVVANALIHQDFSIGGSGPLVEIFSNRMEVTNPGKPLIPPDRFLDTPPRSRNEDLASLMRRFGVCEERGSGIDKVVFEIEFYQLPAPSFEAPGDNTKVMLFAPRSLPRMDKDDRIRACYQHACLKWVSGESMTNATVRKRFGISDKSAAQASRLIKEAVAAGAILPYDEDAAPKLMRYIPWWAGRSRPVLD